MYIYIYIYTYAFFFFLAAIKVRARRSFSTFAPPPKRTCDCQIRQASGTRSGEGSLKQAVTVNGSLLSFMC